MMFGEYIIVIALVLYFHNRSRILKNSDRANSISLFDSFFNGQPFEHVYQSRVGGFKWNVILLCTRLVSFLFFVAIPCIWNYVKNDGYNYKYFTQWNIDLITSYFFLATICSAIGIYHDQKRQKDERNVSSVDFHLINTLQPWSKSVEILSNGTQVLFEVAGGSALFVTVITFILLDPEFVFWNVSEHFVTSLALLLELSLNSLVIRWEHLTFNLSWALLYLIFIWPAVSLSTVNNWPYDFLYTDSKAAFIWYTILFVANVLFYMIWWGLSKLKAKYLMRLNNSQESRPNSAREGGGIGSKRRSEADLMIDTPNYSNLESNYFEGANSKSSGKYNAWYCLAILPW